MNTFAEILKYILPSLVVLATTWYLVKAFLSQEVEKTRLNQKEEILKAGLSVRLQAYERLLLFLERIQPAGMILRINNPAMNAAMMHGALVQAIREEFEHNLSQQLYISGDAWQRIKESKEDMIRLINEAATAVSPDASTAELAQHILMKDIEAQSASVDKSIEFLKNEARAIFFND